MSSLTAALRNPVIRKPQWWIVDVNGQRVGRAATQIASLLQGKHKPICSPNYDAGDYVVVINTEKVEFTGKKWEKKPYRWHTQWPGGLRERLAKDMHRDKPIYVLEHAVRGMLPRNKLHPHRMKRLKLYVGPTHNHDAQNPRKYRINRTKGEDLQGAWGNEVENTITFHKVKAGEPDEHWIMEVAEMKFTNAEKAMVKRNKKLGLLGRSNRREPHPDGYIRGGHPSHGKKW